MEGLRAVDAADSRHALLLFVLVLAFYALTASPHVMLEDDGLFILSGYFGGISHPPGYPLHVLVMWAFSQLPWGTPAYLAHLVSAVFAAAACAALFFCARQIVPGKVPAWGAALTFAVSTTFWSQAIVAEVYSLNAFFFFAVLALCLNLHRQAAATPSRASLATLALVYGLSLSNHWPLMVLASPAYLLLMWPHRVQLLRQAHWLLPMLLFGMLPNAWMVWRSLANPEISFYGPIDSWQRFMFVLSRAGYSGVDASAAAGLADKLAFTGHFLLQLGVQMSLAGLVFALWGFARQLTLWSRPVVYALLLAFVCTSLLLIGMLGFQFDPLHRAVFRVYPLTAYGVWALWLGLGLHLFRHFLIERNLSATRATAVQCAAVAVIVGLTVSSGWSANQQSSANFGEQYAHEVLQAVPQDALLFATGDVSFGTTAYLKKIKKLRPDIDLYQPQGLVLANRLFDPRDSDERTAINAIYQLAQETGRPAIWLGEDPPFKGVERYGFFDRLTFSGEVYSDYRIEDSQYLALERLLSLPRVDDEWHRIILSGMTTRFGMVLGAADSTDEAQVRQRLERYPALMRELDGQLGVVLGLTATPDSRYPGLLLQLLEQLEPQIKQNGSIRQQGLFYLASGAYFIAVGNIAQAEQFLELSVSIWPHKDNNAIQQLVVLYQELGREEDRRRAEALLNHLNG